MKLQKSPQLFDFTKLEKKYYPPSDSMEYYDPEANQFYNSNGTPLRDPEEYDPCQEGYTPWGDE